MTFFKIKLFHYPIKNLLVKKKYFIGIKILLLKRKEIKQASRTKNFFNKKL